MGLMVRSGGDTVAAKARDIMSGSPECVGENDSILEASKKLAKLGVGAMPICGEDDRLKGMLTDRDIVVRVLGEGRDPASTTAGELAQGKPVTIGADDSVSDAITTMTDHKVRRLPVIDGHELVGVVSQADIARNADDEDTGALVALISQP
jgi:CBS domain-containing protein